MLYTVTPPPLCKRRPYPSIISLMKRLLLCLVLFPWNLIRAEVVADSVADFPTSAEQGVNGWTYGYRNQAARGVLAFA